MQGDEAAQQVVAGQVHALVLHVHGGERVGGAIPVAVAHEQRGEGDVIDLVRRGVLAEGRGGGEQQREQEGLHWSANLSVWWTRTLTATPS